MNTGSVAISGGIWPEGKRPCFTVCPMDNSVTSSGQEKEVEVLCVDSKRSSALLDSRCRSMVSKLHLHVEQAFTFLLPIR
jgi:acetolactate synthase regulatory subunit